MLQIPGAPHGSRYDQPGSTTLPAAFVPMLQAFDFTMFCWFQGDMFSHNP